MNIALKYGLMLLAMSLVISTLNGQTDDKCYGTGNFEFGIEKEAEYAFEVTEFQTLKVMDLDNDSIPEIIAVKNGGYLGGLYHFWDIVIINAQTHEIINEIKTCYFLVNLDHYVVLKDDSGGYEIIVAASDYNGFNSNNIKRKLICYRSDGSIKWISDHTFGTGQLLPLSEFNRGGSLSLADFNQDGIPEVYIFNEIFNARTGKKLAAGGKYGIGEIVGYHFGLSVAADMDDNPNDLELVAGYTIYKVKITNAEGLAGNEMTPYNMRFNGKLHDGWSVVADINDDGRLDVIIATFEWVNNAYQAFMYIYTLEKEDCVLIAKKDLGNVRRFSFPIVGNFSNKSESGIVLYTQDTLRKFSYNGSETLSEDWQLTTSQGGRYRLCLLAFDFDNDGVQEIIYRNFKSLKVINSVNDFPVTIGDITYYSNTTHDSPIIADIFNTGTSRICVTCADTTYGGSSPFIDLLARITIFGPPEGKHWAPARNIWHQNGYNPLFINDDGTVPQHMHNPATYKNGKYNNFNVQENLLDGDGKIPAASLYGDIPCIDYDVDTDSYHVSFTVHNRADASASAKSNVPVAFYTGDPEQDGRLIGVYHTTASIAAGENTGTLSYSFPASDITSLWMVAIPTDIR